MVTRSQFLDRAIFGLITIRYRTVLMGLSMLLWARLPLLYPTTTSHIIMRSACSSFTCMHLAYQQSKVVTLV